MSLLKAMLKTGRAVLTTSNRHSAAGTKYLAVGTTVEVLIYSIRIMPETSSLQIIEPRHVDTNRRLMVIKGKPSEMTNLAIADQHYINGAWWSVDEFISVDRETDEAIMVVSREEPKPNSVWGSNT